jgi:hypothetical protein
MLQYYGDGSYQLSPNQQYNPPSAQVVQAATFTLYAYKGPGDIDALTLAQTSQFYGQSAYQTPYPRHFPDLVHGNTSATIPPQFGYAPFLAAPQRVHFG